ncbi:MAG: hypothetical protein HY681_05050 [Chloroflexi bacterium]|nr:hypothetical protein [Chloroflexota bacterium]
MPLTATMSPITGVALGDLATQQVKVSIPSGALAAGTVVTVSNPANLPPVSGSVGKPVTAPVNISLGDGKAEDAPVRLDQLVTVTLKLDVSRLASGSDPTTLWAAFYDAANKKWELFPPDQVDMKAGTMTFTMGHLTNVTAIDIGVGEYTEKIAGNKAVADVLNEKVAKPVIDHLVEKALDHTLKDALGLKDDSTRAKVYSSFVKDDEWGEITAKGAVVIGAGKDASGEDVIDLTQTVNVFVGKKMVENIPEGQLANALTKLSPDKWAQYNEEASEGAGQGYERGIAWTKAGSEAAGYLVEKRYQDAARVIGQQIAEGYPLVTAVKASAEVINYGITVWQNAEIEAAYKAYKNGASMKGGNSVFGIGSKYDVEKGDFNSVWDQMEPVARWAQGQAVKAEVMARNEDSSRGKLPLTDAETERIMEKARVDLKAGFEERVRREAEIEAVHADLKDLLDRAEKLDMLSGTSGLRYPADNLATRVKTILAARATIIKDTRGLKGQKVTNKDIVELTKWYLSGTAAQGKAAYYRELKKRFGIDLGPKPITVTPASITGEPGYKYPFTAKSDNAAGSSIYVWAVNGKQVEGTASNTYEFQSKVEGDFTITVKLVGNDGKEIASGQATAEIAKPKPAERRESGSRQRSIWVENKSSLNVHIWLGHDKPEVQKAYYVPNGEALQYTAFKYTKINSMNDVYSNDDFLVNAVQVNDVQDGEPYDTYDSKKFHVEGYVKNIVVIYTEDGGLELKVDYYEY